MKKLMILVPLASILYAAPTPPSALELKALSSNSVSLSWKDNSDDEKGFKIFRNNKMIGFVSQDTQTYIDSGLSADTTYKYSVKSSDDLGFKIEGSVKDIEHVHLFIDSDHNPSTGYSRYGIVGADMLVQNGFIYQKDGSSQKSWEWKRTGKSKNKLDTKSMFITFDESELGSVDIDKDSSFQAFNYSDDYNSKTALIISSKLAPRNDMKQAHFTQTPNALKNPLKGFMVWTNEEKSPLTYMSMYKGIVRWKNIENEKSDGVDKIIKYSNDHLFNNRPITKTQEHYNVKDKNVKVNPIVVLEFSDKVIGSAFPSGLQVSDHDNQTAVLIDRIDNLVKKLAQAWDNDPRIGFIYTGIIGKWGEQLYTIGAKNEDGNSIEMTITPEVVKALGDSFSKYFKHKKVLVRNPKYYDKTYLETHNNRYRGNTYTNYYRFGMFWDSFAWDKEIGDGVLDTDEVLKNAKLWIDQPILGEVAFAAKYSDIYDFTEYESSLSWLEKEKRSIHDTLTHESSLDYLNDYIRSVHCSGLSWIGNYNEDDEAEAKGALEMQKTMGYRFVLTDASYTDSVKASGELKVSFSVQNVGSAPFYYDWPVEVALLDKDSKKVVWSDRFKNVDIRSWLSGDDWDFDNNRYKKPAKTYTINESFTVAENLKDGEYILAISILDPASMKPSIKFAVTNYYKGGRSALGIVGVGVKPQGNLPVFDDLQGDVLSY